MNSPIQSPQYDYEFSDEGWLKVVELYTVGVQTLMTEGSVVFLSKEWPFQVFCCCSLLLWQMGTGWAGILLLEGWGQNPQGFISIAGEVHVRALPQRQEAGCKSQQHDGQI